MLRYTLQKILYILANLTISRYKPTIVAVTGSVGKTTTKEAVYAVLKDHCHTYRSTRSYNNEIGLPLAILGAKSANRSLLGWLAIIARSIKLLLWWKNKYPKILILEMGADRKGDIEYLTRLAPPTVGVLTVISTSHLEFFKSMAEVTQEKRIIISAIVKGGSAVLNADDELVAATKTRSDVSLLTYGIDNEADVKAVAISSRFDLKNTEGSLGGMNFKVTYEGATVPAHLNGFVGLPSIYAALAGVAVGIHLGLNLVDIVSALREMRGPRGRLRLLRGIKRTTIIDDTYNASPRSVIAALKVLEDIPLDLGERRWAVIGDMTELGADTELGHETIGRLVASNNTDNLVTVGERARRIAQVARKKGMMADNIYSFSNSVEAGRFIQDNLKEGDVVFVKGSQVMRMERVVKEIMSEPLLADKLLVRQGQEWKNPKV